ncbi:uncharacterized protein AB675_3941 [Cyphellophora attinorum]|uniref:Uncharacterized protein n=1 Tax=Cyphellophora attinorum TaxID=1664694 RepID=A0A0N1H0N3_9EURO|nr:uncharacterized protein AB675_3941 [Phialophora attinorum]KPI37522.1 hypothetical protein AB675_3941 [Phialophora attinorum]
MTAVVSPAHIVGMADRAYRQLIPFLIRQTRPQFCHTSLRQAQRRGLATVAAAVGTGDKLPPQSALDALKEASRRSEGPAYNPGDYISIIGGGRRKAPKFNLGARLRERIAVGRSSKSSRVHEKKKERRSGRGRAEAAANQAGEVKAEADDGGEEKCTIATFLRGSSDNEGLAHYPQEDLEVITLQARMRSFREGFDVLERRFLSNLPLALVPDEGPLLRPTDNNHKQFAEKSKSVWMKYWTQTPGPNRAVVAQMMQLRRDLEVFLQSDEVQAHVKTKKPIMTMVRTWLPKARMTTPMRMTEWRRIVNDQIQRALASRNQSSPYHGIRFTTLGELRGGQQGLKKSSVREDAGKSSLPAPREDDSEREWPLEELEQVWPPEDLGRESNSSKRKGNRLGRGPKANASATTTTTSVDPDQNRHGLPDATVPVRRLPGVREAALTAPAKPGIVEEYSPLSANKSKVVAASEKSMWGFLTS